MQHEVFLIGAAPSSDSYGIRDTSYFSYQASKRNLFRFWKIEIGGVLTYHPRRAAYLGDVILPADRALLIAEAAEGL
jgi:hypothetical protein